MNGHVNVRELEKIMKPDNYIIQECCFNCDYVFHIKSLTKMKSIVICCKQKPKPPYNDLKDYLTFQTWQTQNEVNHGGWCPEYKPKREFEPKIKTDIKKIKIKNQIK